MIRKFPSMIGTTIVLLFAFTFVSNVSKLMAGAVWTSCQNPNCQENPPDPPIDGATCSSFQYADVCYGFSEWGCGCKTEELPHAGAWHCHCSGDIAAFDPEPCWPFWPFCL